MYSASYLSMLCMKLGKGTQKHYAVSRIEHQQWHPDNNILGAPTALGGFCSLGIKLDSYVLQSAAGSNFGRALDMLQSHFLPTCWLVVWLRDLYVASSLYSFLFSWSESGQNLATSES